MHHFDKLAVTSIFVLVFLAALCVRSTRIRVPHRRNVWYCGYSCRSCACTCFLAEFWTLQSCNKTTAGLWLDKMRCTVVIEFRIPTRPTFWLTTLDCLDGVGGVPIQLINSVALPWNLPVPGVWHCLGGWNLTRRPFAGDNTSCTVCCFKSTRFTFWLLLLSILVRVIQWVCTELSQSSEKSCSDHSEPQVKSAALTGSDTASRLRAYVVSRLRVYAHPTRCKTSLVVQSVGLSVPGSSVRFRQKLQKSRTQIYIWAHKASSKATVRFLTK